MPQSTCNRNKRTVWACEPLTATTWKYPIKLRVVLSDNSRQLVDNSYGISVSSSYKLIAMNNEISLLLSNCDPSLSWRFYVGKTPPQQSEFNKYQNSAPNTNKDANYEGSLVSRTLNTAEFLLYRVQGK